MSKPKTKTCMECRYLGNAKETGTCAKQNICLYPEEFPACTVFEPVVEPSPVEDALKAEVERLRAVLRGIVVLCDGYTNSRRKKEDINHTIYWVRKLAKDRSINNNTDVITKERKYK